MLSRVSEGFMHSTTSVISIFSHPSQPRASIADTTSDRPEYSCVCRVSEFSCILLRGVVCIFSHPTHLIARNVTLVFEGQKRGS